MTKIRPSVDDTRSFPLRLELAMKRKGISQEELARQCGSSQSSISYYLLGDRFPRLPMLYKIAKALDVNPLWLLGHDTQDESESILEKYFALDAADQAKVMGYLEELLSDPKYKG